MANEYAVNASDMLSIANAIREKGGTTDKLVFPEGFIDAIHNISGGGVDIDLISVASAEELPQTARENTIAVINEYEAGELYICPTIPESANNTDVLLINTGTNKIINASEDGKLAFGNSGVYMRIMDSWIYVDSYIFTNGVWKPLWFNRLYYEGNKYPEYTGGYTAHKISSKSGASATKVEPKITENADSIVLDTTSTGNNGVGAWITTNAIDLTPYSAIVFEGTFTSKYPSYPQNFVAAAWEVVPEYYTLNRLAYYEQGESTTSTITIDVSNVNTSAYIGFGLAYSKVTLNRCYLVPKELE